MLKKLRVNGELKVENVGGCLKSSVSSLREGDPSMRLGTGYAIYKVNIYTGLLHCASAPLSNQFAMTD